jgi:acyl carrier protein
MVAEADTFADREQTNQVDFKGEIRRFILDEVLMDPFDGEDPLRAGAVDSLGIEMIVEYVWEAFRVEIEDEEIVYENFESLPALVALIESHR